MSARAAVYKLIAEDPILNDVWDVDGNAVFPNADLDVAPREGFFIVLRWGEEEIAWGRVGYENLTIWAHYPRQLGTDHAPLVSILMRISDVLMAATQVAGEDGVLTTCRYQGMSGDFNDEVLKTISKNVAVRVVSQPATVE